MLCVEKAQAYARSFPCQRGRAGRQVQGEGVSSTGGMSAVGGKGPARGATLQVGGALVAARFSPEALPRLRVQAGYNSCAVERPIR